MGVQTWGKRHTLHKAFVQRMASSWARRPRSQEQSEQLQSSSSAATHACRQIEDALAICRPRDGPVSIQIDDSTGATA